MKERHAWKMNGFVAILLFLVVLAGAVFTFVEGVVLPAEPSGLLVITTVILSVVLVIILTSLTIVQPNEAKVILFFGKYIGTITQDGIWMTVPFTDKKKISLKVRNFNSHKLKVNDAEGNPIEIAAVVVFKVIDTAKATFDVDNYEMFVEIQSETAVRHIAVLYPYDTFTDDQPVSLRGNADHIAAELLTELQNRLNGVGVQILETRLTHLAYSPEIAGAMLQRQQASAIVSARRMVVEGAVGMVELALQQLMEKGIEFDDERRAAMVNNLMVSIVSDRAATPVINAGTLYSA